MSYQNNRRGGEARRGFQNGGRPNRSFGNNRGRSGGRKNTKENIHFSRFIKPAQPAAEVVVYEPNHQFADFAINDLIKQNIAKKGIITPSPIQDQAIPVGLAGGDIVGIANTGTGKTLAFAVPVLNRMLSDKKSRALIIAPTRELAQQIEDECKQIAKNSGLFGAVLIGGSAMGPQLSALRGNPEIVIGTPGRIKDHMERGTLRLSQFNMVVLDEFDRMLDMGFVNDMRAILSEMPDEHQSFFFSATLDERVRGLINEFANDPVTISVKSGETIDNVSQDVVRYQTHEDKIEKLHDLLNEEVVAKVLVFDETKFGVERLGKALQDRGFAAGSIHGGKTQGARQRTLNDFKSNKITVLVATDVAARGIDVSDVTHVINYSTPQTYTDYVHRIGRAGRAGRVGHALTFIER